ncbi:MAG: hypothetical protein ACODAD_05900, partial [Planctomycetota bacterium]
VMTRPTFNGHNASVWRRDLVRVNGFDERMLYGGLDRELGERLTNAGIFGKQIRHRAPCVHLHHERGYVTEWSWACNHKIRSETRRHRFTWTPYGIRQDAESRCPHVAAESELTRTPNIENGAA